MLIEPVIDDLYLESLPPVARDHALYLEGERLRKDAFGIIVWAAVLLEALLDDALRAAGEITKSSEERPDLVPRHSDFDSLVACG